MANIKKTPLENEVLLFMQWEYMQTSGTKVDSDLVRHGWWAAQKGAAA